MRNLVYLMVGLLLLTGCNQFKVTDDEQSTATVTASEILTNNPNADIFQLEGTIYSNASNIDWVQKQELSIGTKIGTITKQYKDGLTFEDGMATKLPVGAEIFEPTEKNGLILIVKFDNKEIRYLGLIEG